MIASEEILELIKEENLIEKFSPEIDHPDYGVYLRLGEVHKMGSGTGHFPEGGEPETPSYNKIAESEGYTNNSVILEPGVVYALRSFEEINLPEDIFGRLYPHGTMFASGVSILGDMVKPGYTGNVRLVAINNTERPFQIDLDSLFCKMVFIRVGN